MIIPVRSGKLQSVVLPAFYKNRNERGCDKRVCSIESGQVTMLFIYIIYSIYRIYRIYI